MSRHRNVRTMNFEDEYFDEDEVYGHSYDDSYCVSPATAAQFTFNRERDVNLSSYMEEGIPEEEDESDPEPLSDSGRDNLKLDDVEQAKLNSCKEEIVNVIGDTIPEHIVSQAVVKHQYNIQAALNELLNQSEAPKPQRQPRPDRRANRQEFAPVQPTVQLKTPVKKNTTSDLAQATSATSQIKLETSNQTVKSANNSETVFGTEKNTVKDLHTKAGNLNANNEVDVTDSAVLNDSKLQPVNSEIDLVGDLVGRDFIDTPSKSSSSSVPATPKSTSKVKQDKAKLKEEYERRKTGKDLLNLVVIGHVDAGKSTLMGHLLYQMGVVNKRAMHKYEQESKKRGKGSFAFAWVLDETEEERTRGVTMDIAQTAFETPHKQITLLDAPGHKDFIPNMITGAAQADVAILVVNATRGEFETGFESGGQTREHALLARSLGVSQLLVAVNKMDTVDWSQSRYDDIVKKLGLFLKQAGYKDIDLSYIPCSGLGGENLTKAVSEPKLASWYKGSTLVEQIVPYSHHRNSSYLCRIEGCVRHFDTRAQLERHRKDKHGPTEACPHCRYVVPQSRPYLMRNHLERVHRIHHVQPDSVRRPPTVPSPAVPATVSASVSSNVPLVSSPAPSPVHGSRSQLTPLRSPSLDISLEPVEITTKDHDLLSYVVEATGIFDPPRKILRRDSSPVSEFESPPHFTPETPVVPVISAQVSRPEHHDPCPVVPESLDQATLPSSGAVNSSVTVTPVPDYFLRRLEDISTASEDADPYAFLAADPRLFFAGAPSGMFPSGAARILQEAHSRARKCGQRSLHHVPLGFGAIQRVERVSLPDGTTYSLTATWTKDPHFQITKEVATQTSEDISPKPAPRPSCVEKDKFKAVERPMDKPFRLIISDVFKGLGSGFSVVGRVSSGSVQAGDRVLVQPAGDLAVVKAVTMDDSDNTCGFAGDHVTVVLTGMDMAHVNVGSVLCDPQNPIKSAMRIRARIVIFNLELPITRGFTVVFHYQSITEPAIIKRLNCQLNKNTGEVIKNKPKCLVKNSSAVVEIEFERPVCLEMYKDYKDLGRFMLRQGGHTIAAGLVEEVLKTKSKTEENSTE